MSTSALELQVQLLQHQIELEESNYKHALQLQKDYNVLRRLREHIRTLKDNLKALAEGVH